MAEKVLIKRFDKSIPLPEHKTAGSVAFDLSARLETVIKPGETGKVPLNVAIKLPEGYWGLMAARSSLQKKGLSMANGIGVFDSDFCGNEDEYHALLRNTSGENVRIEKGERITQLILVPIIQTNILEVQEMVEPNRGGIGSTGTHA